MIFPGSDRAPNAAWIDWGMVFAQQSDKACASGSFFRGCKWEAASGDGNTSVVVLLVLHRRDAAMRGVFGVTAAV
jgi:hypothetical protein